MPDEIEQSPLKVSVIIPTYDRADYLREALDSVFAQSYLPWEVIVVDDGSTDDTPAVVQSYGSRVRYVRHDQNRGISAARNSGLNAAQGDLIAWLDSDDLWEADFLATLVPLLMQDLTLDGVYTGITMVDANGVILGTSARIEKPRNLYDALVRDCFLTTPSIVVWKRCYDQVGDFDPQFRIAEDYDMWLRLASNFHIVGIPLPMVRIRIHATNTMADVDALCKARLAVARKHFGKFSNDSVLTETSKVAFGYALRFIALKYIENAQPASGWPYLQKAAALHPAILERLDTFYELACGSQPRGYRGSANSLNIEANGVAMLEGLRKLFAEADPSLKPIRRTAFGKANLALCILSDQTGHWGKARRYMRQALSANPRLLLSYRVLRRFIKLCMGKKFVGMLKQWKS